VKKISMREMATRPWWKFTQAHNKLNTKKKRIHNWLVQLLLKVAKCNICKFKSP